MRHYRLQAMSTKVIGLNHCAMIVADLERSLRFYQELLGLEPDPTRPDLGYPGAWFRLGEQQLHLMQLPNPDPIDRRPEHGGRDRHIAFWVEQLQPIEAELARQGIPFTKSRSGRAALFLRDPDGNALELVERG